MIRARAMAAVLVLALAGCMGTALAAPHAGRTPKPKPTPTTIATPTPAPTVTATPTPSPTPTATPSATPSPTPPLSDGCANYESQAWWTTTPGEAGTNFGHLHLGSACFPWKATVSGVITIPIRAILHENPGTFDYFNSVLKTDSQEISLPHNTELTGWTCAGTCTRAATATIDTRLSDYDGLQEIRIRAYVREPDGNVMHASVNVIVNIQNGDPENPLDRKAYSRAKGWYTGSGYCEANVLTDIPIAPVANWTPTVQVQWHGAAEDLPVSRYRVTVDADAHAGIPGTVILSGNGELAPTQLNLGALGSGTHRLAIRAECDDPRGSTNSGIEQVFWTVP